MHFALFQYIVIIICGILTGLTSLYVLLSNPYRSVNRFFAFFSGGIAFWSLGLSLLFFFHSSFFIILILEGGLMLAAGLFFFGIVFPDGTLSRKELWFFAPISGVAVLVPFKVFISDVTINQAGYIIPHNEKLFSLYAITLVFYMLGGVHVLIKKRGGPFESVQGQLKYFFVSIVIFAVTSVVCDVVLPSFSFFRLNLIGPVTSLFFVATTAYSIFRHNLMDIRIVIQRSLIYVLLLSIIGSIYIVGLQLLGLIVHEVTNTSVIISAGITTMLGIFFMQPLENYFEKITDPIFFKDKYVYSDALKRLSRMLNTTMSQADVVASSSQALKEIFKTTRVEFLLKDSKASESRNQGGITMPIIFEEKNIGTIILGPKRSGDKYNYQDTQLLETFLNHAAVALEKGRLYEKVEEYNAHLENIVEERTKEIKQIQQEQKRTMIDISHNLQTPLAIINGELELMADYYPDQEKIFAVKRAFLRVSEFIRQLLHLARLDGSVYDIPFSAVNISDLLEQQIEYFEVMGNEDGLIVTANIQPDIVFSGNARLLGEAFTNIAQNALKYRRRDITSTLHISLVEKDSAIIIHMNDNGIGMKKEELSEIFNRFYRTPLGSQTSQGSGLGLAIVKKIVEMHNGAIFVSSIPGHGTKFIITFDATD
jgi:signal transduction histidine kinase